MTRPFQSLQPSYPDDKWRRIHVDEYYRTFFFHKDYTNEISIETLLSNAHSVRKVVIKRSVDDRNEVKTRYGAKDCVVCGTHRGDVGGGGLSVDVLIN